MISITPLKEETLLLLNNVHVSLIYACWWLNTKWLMSQRRRKGNKDPSLCNFFTTLCLVNTACLLHLLLAVSLPLNTQHEKDIGKFLWHPLPLIPLSLLDPVPHLQTLFKIKAGCKYSSYMSM
jgi:hypothetical protein